MLFRHVPDPPGELTRRFGLAALEACRRTAGVRGLKWPNDLVADGAKLAGILAERVPSGPVVVGLGLNVGWAPPRAARLGDGIEPLDVLAVAMLAAYDELPGDVFERYRSRLVTLGQDVRVELPAGHIEGRAVDVERDGRLVALTGRALDTAWTQATWFTSARGDDPLGEGSAVSLATRVQQVASSAWGDRARARPTRRRRRQRRRARGRPRPFR